jgi:hypothetical protein
LPPTWSMEVRCVLRRHLGLSTTRRPRPCLEEAYTHPLAMSLASDVMSTVQGLLGCLKGAGAPEYPQQLVDKLGLIPHPEGGFFREVYRSGAEPMASKGETDPAGATLAATGRTPPERNVMTSIYWLLNRESPVGWWCR